MMFYLMENDNFGQNALFNILVQFYPMETDLQLTSKETKKFVLERMHSYYAVSPAGN